MEPQVEPPASRARLMQLEDTWVVRVERAQGKPQDYRCATEALAKQLLQVLAAKPT
jgi:hypothetical protein